MLTLINRFSKYIIFILSLLLITVSSAQDEGAINITNIDGSSGQLLATDGNGQLYRLTLVPLSKAQASAITSTTAQTGVTSDRDENISILDVDANGEVDALTDGLLLLRSMFELTDDALVTGVVDSVNCKECGAEGIDQYISTVKESTYGKLSANDDQNISGSSLDGKTLTIGIENGTSETVDLSGLTNELEIFQVIAQSAITANTAKTGITSDQASAITANTAKVGISDDQVEAINQISVNTEILSSYDSAITANTAKVGMTLGTTSSTALAGDALSGDVQIGNSASDKIGFYGVIPVAKLSASDIPAIRTSCSYNDCVKLRNNVLDNRAAIDELIRILQTMGLIN